MSGRPMQKVVFLGVSLVVLVFLCVLFWKTGWVNGVPVSAKKELALREEPSRIRVFELEALAGSVDAADALMVYHSKCHIRDELSPDATPKRFTECADQVRFWTTIALENGSLPAAQRQTNVLLESSRCRDIYRAEFWFKKFRKYFSESKILLKSVQEEIAEKKKSCAWN